MTMLANRLNSDLSSNLWGVLDWADNYVAPRNFKVDIYQKDGQYVIEAALPGVTKDEINIDIQNDTMEISVEKKQDIQEDRKYLMREFSSYQKYSRTFRLPKNIDAESVSAELKDGILRVFVTESRKNKVVIH